MAKVPLLDSHEKEPNQSSLSLGSLVRYIKSMSGDKALEDHMTSKVKKNWQTFALPPGDQITALSAMQDGFIYGLRSGKVVFVAPPASLTLAFLAEPVVGVFAASNYFILAASHSECKTWNVQKESEGPAVALPCDVQVTCVTGNMAKEVVFLGLSDSAVLQYTIKDKDQCLLGDPFVLKAPGKDEVPVSEIQTLDSASWLAVRLSSKDANAFALWDHTTRTLIHYITFTAGPGLPRSWKSGEDLNLPRFFSPKGRWAVFPDCIILAPNLVFHLKGTSVTEMASVNRYAETHGKTWAAYSKALESGNAPFFTNNALITFTHPGAPKKRPSEKLANETELDFGLNFSLVARSEANNYLAFACDSSLEVLCLSGIDTEYTHGLAGVGKYTKRGFLFTRFGKLVTGSGETVLQLQQKERLIGLSRGWEWLVTGIFEGPKMKKMRIKHHSRPQEITFEGDEVLRMRFSKNCEYLGVILSTSFVIYNLSDCVQVFSDQRDFSKATCRLKLAHSGSFIATRDGKDLVIVVPGAAPTYMEIPWTLSRICFVNPGETNDIIAYNMYKTVRCTLENLEGSASLEEGFERVKAINSGQHCIGFNASGMYVLSASTLTKLIRLPADSHVVASKATPTLYSLVLTPNSTLYSMVDVWNLNLGVRNSRIYTGLRHILGNKLVIRGPGMWRAPAPKLIMRLDTCKVLIKNSWIMDLESLSSLPAEALHTPKALNLLEESFEMHCLAWKGMAALLNNGEFSEQLLELVIEPVNVTLLHLLAYKGKAEPLAQAVASGAAILKSSFGSPLALCIQRKSRKCLNILLSHLVVLREDSPSDFFSALTQVAEDMHDLIEFGSPYLLSFLQQVMVPLPEEFLAPTIICPSEELPIPTLEQSMWVQWTRGKEESTGEKVAVEYLICPFPVQCTLGSTQSLKRMKFLTNEIDEIELFDTAFIKTFIDMKWNSLWPYIFANTLLYWALMFALVSRIFQYFDPNIDSIVFLVLNSWFALGEILQASQSLADYFTDYWNYVDIGRFVLGYLWIVTSLHDQQWLTFILLLLTVIRGITFFKTFDLTRYYVLMIVVVVRKTCSFILIYFYSTLCFGLLFAAVHPESFPDFLSIWQMAYSMNMGAFDFGEQGNWYWFVYMIATLLNVVIMLNLVVSVLGDAFGSFQEIANAADLYEKADVIYDHEVMMFWRRGQNTPQFLQICQEEAGEELQESPQVKAARKALRLLRGKVTGKKKEKESKFQLMMQRIDQLEESMNAKLEGLVRK